ncbi:MAG: helix-hairpin-helix domain-containing protein [Phycisphaerales bacterium]
MTTLRFLKSRRRAFATALVVWAIGLSILVLSAIQLAAWRQAADGREALARVRARWAARAGVEAVIARLQAEFDAASPLGAQSLVASLATVSTGTLRQASYEVNHDTPTGRVLGVADAGAKINVNVATFDDLMLLPDMTEDVADAIVDWIDTDEEVSEAGAESESYGGLASAYRTRNAPVPDLGEIELVLGVRREYLYGAAAPSAGPVRASAATDGWAKFLTGSSIAGGLSASGQERIDLSTAAAQDVVAAAGVDQTQAEAIVSHASSGSASMADFIRTDLATLAQASGGTTPGRAQPSALSRDELVQLLAECTIGDPAVLNPGKLNVNTADDETLEYLAALSPTLRDALVLFRDQQGGDIASIADLLDIPQMSRDALADLFPFIDVRSNVFHMRSVGRDEATGLSVELLVEVDRSSNPVVIRSLAAR